MTFSAVRIWRLTSGRCRRRAPAWWIAGLLLVVNSAAFCHAADEAIDFERDVQPILARHCHRCHGADKQESGLRLDSRAAMLSGGDLGEKVLVPGESQSSALVQAVTGERADLTMPPEGEPLSAAEVQVLRAWVNQGAAWPEGEEPSPVLQARDFWAFRPLAPGAPNTSDAWLAGRIDAYLLARLRQAGLAPSAEAPRRTLVRRLYLDLLGMPPSPEEIDDFLTDDSPTAYERLVDRLLASPRFGERAARHWLDVARFAETNGFETNTPRPSAYHYRDWVVDACNSDLPYDRFVFEQLAGDSVGADAATGFLVGGAYDEVKSPDANLTAMQRQNELADMVSATGMAFLGMTVGCARCHNHKFDPIAQREYYALQAVFAGVRHGNRPLRGPAQVENERRLAECQTQLDAVSQRLAEIEAASDVAVDASSAPDAAQALRPPVSPLRNIERFAPVTARRLRFVIEATNDGAEPCLDELELFASTGAKESPNLALSASVLNSSGDYAGNEKHKLSHLNDGRGGNSFSWISSESGRGWVLLEFAEPIELERIEWARDREGVFRDRLATRYTIEVGDDAGLWRPIASSQDRLPPGAPREEIARHRMLRLPDLVRAEAAELIARQETLSAELETRRKQIATAYAGAFEQPAPTMRLFRGDPMQPREAVAPGALSFGGEATAGLLELSDDAPEAERRAALARWLVDPRRPLAARVAANRVWQSHFGVGLVATASDFGANGAPPSHGELLDYLAGELIESGWSLKRLHRAIVLSRAYRQASTPAAAAQAIDADNRLLWRFSPRRLEAEAVRDGVLAASGVLDLKMHGPGYSAFEPNENYVRVYEPRARFGAAEWRRMIYMFKVRMEQDAIFGAFDCPDAGQPTPRRGTSTTALQAMNLLNSEFMLEQSNLLSERCLRERPGELASQIDRAFELTLGRAADEEERQAALEVANQYGLAAVCRALYNANEFVFLP